MVQQVVFTQTWSTSDVGPGSTGGKGEQGVAGNKKP